MILFIHSFQVLNTLSCMVLTAVNADVGGHFNIVIGLLVFRRRRLYLSILEDGQRSERASESRIQNHYVRHQLIASYSRLILYMHKV